MVTPRLHNRHHSTDPAERASNFSSGLTLWDLLHGSYRYDEHPAPVGLETLPAPGV